MTCAPHTRDLSRELIAMAQQLVIHCSLWVSSFYATGYVGERSKNSEEFGVDVSRLVKRQCTMEPRRTARATQAELDIISGLQTVLFQKK